MLFVVDVVVSADVIIAVVLSVVVVDAMDVCSSWSRCCCCWS